MYFLKGKAYPDSLFWYLKCPWSSPTFLVLALLEPLVAIPHLYLTQSWLLLYLCQLWYFPWDATALQFISTHLLQCILDRPFISSPMKPAMEQKWYFKYKTSKVRIFFFYHSQVNIPLVWRNVSYNQCPYSIFSLMSHCL